MMKIILFIRITSITNMKNLISPVFILLIAIACNTNKPAPSVKELIAVDSTFSRYSEKSGYSKAFIEFAHPDVIMLRDNNLPLVGRNSLVEVFKNRPTEGVLFTWEPLGGEIAKSGELGFTYGIYSFHVDSLSEKGTYVSVWKKDNNGNWKYILDSGNEGTGE